MKNALKFPALLALAAALTVGSASAQTAQSIIDKVDAAQKSVKDVSFRISGNASLEGSGQKFDVDVQAIPAQNVVRVNFNAPDVLADNVVVLDKDNVYNYQFLTNQVFVQKASKAAQGFGFTFDVNQFADATSLLGDRYDVKLVGSATQGSAKVYVLEATPKDGVTDRSRVWISEDGWRPVRLQVLNVNGKVVADLNITNYRTNAGLSAAKVKSLPRDAEVVRR